VSAVIPTTSGKPFCEVSSEAPMYSSNLQLFALRQAFRYWRILSRCRARLSQPRVTEYLVFITICAGTSISQLLGQNATHSGPEDRVSAPKELFDQLFGVNHPKRSDFRDFIDLYDDCRHFGSPKYPSIASLTEARCKRYLDLVVTLWDEMVKEYIAAGNDPDSNLAELTSVRDLV